MDRRQVLRLAGPLIAGLAAACRSGRDPDRPEPLDPADRPRLNRAGQLTSRPHPAAGGTPPTGLLPLQLSGSDRDGVVYVPPSYRPDLPATLVVSLHGAGGSGLSSFRRRLRPLAEEAGLIVLAPDSRGPTWDIVSGAFGPDVQYLDRSLDLVFARYAIAPSRVAVEGFSDGASYALTLGLLNGDLFGHVIAFSPGFVADGSRRGKPRIFISHGVQDRILPVDLCSRRIVRALRRDAYDVRYLEFAGGHTVPADTAREALAWLSRHG